MRDYLRWRLSTGPHYTKTFPLLGLISAVGAVGAALDGHWWIALQFLGMAAVGLGVFFAPRIFRTWLFPPPKRQSLDDVA